MGKSVLQTGPGVTVYINGTDWGVVTGVDLSMGSPNKETLGIDDSRPFELVPTCTSTGGQIELLKVRGDNGLEGRGITAGFNYINTEQYFTLMLVDRVSQKVLFRADHCKVEAQNWKYAAKSIVMGSFSFKGLSWGNDYTGEG